ncbi:MAG: Gfo/Idh/MocA family oxidoreductase [Lentisphaerae bacterium]|jgi:predicted dehydrogenase|nr:Gfo/Idh/MocA family oxidoreductase [Lentisphaerota bacterium]MBT4821543.1 Gfo/Idh/MocA family oxidoreductase [Lentisphaerota bacterium]MBT5608411.1 Gfo/Idh/MocA family oxidoreductase [Lentisphaerota bacterium]MBT7054969.1 Gfo/Idh/MocA family oxidoreductase [Lentisphaerota bacterium]MBT7844834.1 Gfo/Idh/MocA family oxidoreductase [Lentisphaerota bacterium]
MSMPKQNAMGIAVVGCGRIAQSYARSLLTDPERVRLVGGYDIIAERTDQFAETFGGKAYPDYDAVLSDSDVDIIANLTTQQAHAAVTGPALHAGKHVHSEKPLACDRQEGLELLELAAATGMRLSCSPFTFLGEAQQTFIRAAREGGPESVRVAYSEMNWGAIERRNPRPIPFLQHGAGPLLDVGVYALTLLTAALGPVGRVTGFAQIVQPERVIRTGPDAGVHFQVETPDQVLGGLEFECGTVGRITASFRDGKSKQANGTEFHAHDRSLFLESNVSFDTNVESCNLDTDEWTPVPCVAPPFKGVEWGRAVFDLVDSLRTGTPQHCTGEQAYHVLDICLSILEAAGKECPVDVVSRFEIPPLMSWASGE